MSDSRTPPRFVPTLTDVVPAPQGLMELPVSLLDEPASGHHAAPAAASEPTPAPDIVAFADEQESLVQHLQALLQERLQQALREALEDLEPLLREALARMELESEPAPVPRAPSGESDAPSR